MMRGSRELLNSRFASVFEIKQWIRTVEIFFPKLQQNRPRSRRADSAAGACIDHCSLKAKFSEICERCRLVSYRRNSMPFAAGQLAAFQGASDEHI